MIARYREMAYQISRGRGDCNFSRSTIISDDQRDSYREILIARNNRPPNNLAIRMIKGTRR